MNNIVCLTADAYNRQLNVRVSVIHKDAMVTRLLGLQVLIKNDEKISNYYTKKKEKCLRLEKRNELFIELLAEDNNIIKHHKLYAMDYYSCNTKSKKKKLFFISKGLAIYGFQN